jgi:uncharacterized repeat protein (TIGR03837 family)
MNKPVSCDIFCNVVDNYGDIGVCWRLARQLANEHGVAVRLWVDDLASFCRLCPEADAALAQQRCQGVEIRHWVVLFPQVEPAHLVIEAFACELPQGYVAAMAVREHKPVWINLEYLSAEDWVEGCHKLPSPHPSLPLVKYFFFPGFTEKTGGLLLERDLIARRDAFQGDARAIAAYWESMGVPAPQADEVRVSLFCYENPALPELLRAWEQSAKPVSCLVPEGRVLPQVAAFFGQAQIAPGDVFRRGNLTLHVLPFTEQARYDELLWACDINFVRGEDSFVRAQWAGKPCVWHIYPQYDGVHMQKLRAFMARFCAGLTADAALALHGLWEAWNLSAGSEEVHSAWNDFLAHRSMLRQHAQAWAQELSHNSLALNLLDFFREVDRMRGS